MKLWILIAFLFPVIVVFGQVPEQDCVAAIDVCESTYSYSSYGIAGSGNVPNEINGTISCLTGGELNAVWFRVYTTQAGILKFTIKPYDNTANYDWAVYNLTQANCSDIYNNPTLEVSCNSSTSTTNNGYTGPNGNSEPQEEQGIGVGDGEWYYIAVSSPSTTTTGFIIDFNGSTSLGGSNPLEFINSNPPNLIPANQLYVYLNQPVHCFSMTVSDFRVYDNNNQEIPITSLVKPFCGNPSNFTSSCVLFLNTDLIEGMQYKVAKVGNMQTRCTHIDTGYAELVFIAPPAVGTITSHENRPEQDCITAMPLCSANMYINTSYTGQGLVANELNNNQACLGAGELNSVWFRIPIASDGNLNFTIRPTEYDTDFDWVIYNLTNANCADIYTNPTLETECSFSGNTSPLGITGANGGPNPQDEPVIPVLAGEEYYLLVSNFSATFSGFQLDMTHSTCGIEYQFDETFSDSFTPQYFPPYNLQVLFNNYISCNSAQTSDFALYNTQTGFQYSITNVEPYLCNGPGDSTTTKFQLTIFPQLAPNTEYTIIRNGEILSMCGVPSISTDTVTFISYTVGLPESLAPSFTVNTFTTDKIMVSASMPLSGAFNLYNLSGMLLQTHRIENATTLQMDMENYSNGLYILTFTNNKGQSYSAKVVKAGY